MRDVRNALRQVVKRPGFALVIVLMLAVGIGTLTGMYSIYHTILLEPLPVPQPERLVNFSSPGPKWGATSSGSAGRNEYVFSYPMLRDLETEQDAFTGIAGHRIFGANLSFDEQTVSATGVLVSGHYFDVLGLRPALGSLIGPRHTQEVGQSAVAVLTYDYWRDEFGSSPEVLNSTLVVNGERLTIIGVAPEAFTGTTLTADPKIFVPLTLYERMMPNFGMGSDDRRAYWIYLFARLRDGIGVDAAWTSINRLYSAIVNDVEVPLNAEMPDNMLEQFRARRIMLEPGAQGQSNAPRVATAPLTLLLAVSALVLAIVCVNIAGLLLVRGEGRSGETAVRASLGATRRQLIAQFLTESGLLAALGALASVAVASATIKIVVSVLPARNAGHIDFGLDWSAFAFTGTVAVVTLFLFGLVPALRSSGTAPGALVNASGSKTTRSRSVARFRSILAGGQIGLSTILLVIAGLFFQSLINIERVDLGMQVDSLVTFSVSPRRNGYDDERATAVFDRLERELAAVPGVTGVASSMVPLLTGSNWNRTLSVAGRESGPGIDTDANIHRVGPDFFTTLSMPIIAGRDFQDSDVLGSPQVAVVNEAFLEKFALDVDETLGRRVGIGDMNAELDIEVVGIVPDAKYSEVKDAAPPQLYLARSQAQGYSVMNFYVRGDAAASELMAGSVAVLKRIDPNLPIQNVTLMRDVVANNVFLDRLISTLATAFAVIAALLAGTGLYGTLAYSVSQRTRELGIRLALGATPAGLRGVVLRQVAMIGVLGGVPSLALGVYLANRAEALLYETSIWNPLALGSASVLIAAIVLAAGSIPARRAARTQPMEALRYE